MALTSTLSYLANNVFSFVEKVDLGFTVCNKYDLSNEWRFVERNFTHFQ